MPLLTCSIVQLKKKTEQFELVSQPEELGTLQSELLFLPKYCRVKCDSESTAQTDSCYKTMTHRETSKSIKSRCYTGPFKLQSSSDWNACKTLREQCKEEWARVLPLLCKTPIKSHRFTWFTIKLLLLKVFLQVTESWSGVFLTLLQHYSLFFVK